MMLTGSRKLAFVVVTFLTAGVSASAHGQDFFSALFGGLDVDRPHQPVIQAPNNRPTGETMPDAQPRRSHGYAGSQAFCVRTCDGRYFPIQAGDGKSRAASCNSFCPASETKIVYGSSIDQAATDSGKSYSELPNAFRYRKEIVSGCTCNGKDATGLAVMKIEEDPTLRKGDIVAGADGLMVNHNPDRRGASLNMSPVSQSVRAKYEKPPVVVED
jgi:hypothetical protein